MEKEKQIKQKYEELAKKYKLPKYEEVNPDLELLAIDLDKCGIFLNALVRITFGKLQYFLSFMDPFLGPQPTSTYTFIVFKGLTDDKRKEIMKNYKKMMVLYQKGLAVILKTDDEKAEYLKEVWKAYPEFKKKMIKLLDDLNEIFLREEARAEKRGYMG